MRMFGGKMKRFHIQGEISSLKKKVFGRKKSLPLKAYYRRVDNLRGLFLKIAKKEDKRFFSRVSRAFSRLFGA